MDDAMLISCDRHAIKAGQHLPSIKAQPCNDGADSLSKRRRTAWNGSRRKRQALHRAAEPRDIRARPRDHIDQDRRLATDFLSEGITDEISH